MKNKLTKKQYNIYINKGGMTMYTYKHRVKYYETDKMGITHHSNYIRIMEEARVEWMDYMGWSFKKCEDLNMTSPVLSVKCDYKHHTTFDDIIEVEVRIKTYNGIRMSFEYVMKKDDEIVAIGETEHCFLNANGLPIRIKKEYPEFDELLRNELEE